MVWRRLDEAIRECFHSSANSYDNNRSLVNVGVPVMLEVLEDGEDFEENELLGLLVE